MSFRDRSEAGRQLATALAHLRGLPGLVVLAIPRGGVPVAAELAEALQAPLDLWIAHKLGAPGNAELAIGSVAENGDLLVDEAMVQRLRIPPAYLVDESRRQRTELARRSALYRAVQPPLDLNGKTVVLVDDGIATGATADAALQALRRRGVIRCILAAPIAPPEALERFSHEADELAILQTPKGFHSVGQFYDRFDQVSDAQVISALKRFHV